MGYGGFGGGGDDGPGPFIYREACVLALGLLAAEAGEMRVSNLNI